MSLQVNVIEARNLTAADSNGFSDPYAIVILGTQSVKTKIKQGTLNPIWNEIFNLKLKNDDFITIELWDWDALTSDDFLGYIRINLKELTNDGPVWYQLRARDDRDAVSGDVCLRIRFVSNMQNTKSYDVAMSAVTKRINSMRVSNNNYDDEDQGPVLDISSLSLSKVPQDSISMMMEASIKRVDISFNSFTALPDLGAVSLFELTASGNPIIDISAVGYMTTLRTLVLNGAHLTEIPPLIGKLRYLEKLEVGNNQIAKLPIEIGRLNKLEELSLTGNPITSVPPHMGGLIALETLDLSNCQLTTLPEEFTLMTRLMELNLGNNQLTKLPEDIGRMTRLVSLNVMDNELTDLPLSIGMCIGLGKIGSGIALARNPIISQDMFAKYKIGVDHLLEWLDRRLQLEGPYILQNITLPADLWPPGEKRGSGFLTPNTSSSGGLQASPGQIRAAKAAATAAATQPSGVSPTPARAATPPSKPLTQQDIDTQLGTKVVVLKNWGITTLRTEIRPKLGKMKLGVTRPGVALQDIMEIARAVKAIKLEADKCVPFVEARPPPKFVPSPADKQEALKLVLCNTLDDIAFILDGLQRVLQTTVQTTDVITAMQAVKSIKPMVAEAPPKN